MSNFIRRIVAFAIMSPILIVVFITSIFTNREKAVIFWGPTLTSITKVTLRIFVPKIRSKDEFNHFKSKLKSYFWRWRVFFTVSVEKETDDLIKLKVLNCPFCEVIQFFGYKEMAPYVCKADWKLAKQYQKIWEFDRVNEIGKGDLFCDTTYKRKI